MAASILLIEAFGGDWNTTGIQTARELAVSGSPSVFERYSGPAFRPHLVAGKDLEFHANEPEAQPRAWTLLSLVTVEAAKTDTGNIELSFQLLYCCRQKTLV